MCTLIYSAGFISMSVCTDDTDEEMLAFVNAEHPTGLEHGWEIASEGFRNGQPNPSPCELEPGRRHVLLHC